MNIARTRSAIMVLGLLACGASLASVRMDGLGWRLTDIIDDPVTDLLTYPQLNVLTPGWLVGVETDQKGYYHPYARTSGRWSLAAALDATLWGQGASCDPSLALATQVGPLSLGASARFAFIDEPVSPPKDISWGWISFNHDVGVAVVGVRWNRPGMALDVNVSGDEYDHYMWSTDGGSDTLFERYYETSLTPLLRVTWLRGRLHWRAIMTYRYAAGDWPDHHVSRVHAVSLAGSSAYSSASLLATGGLRAMVNSEHRWDLVLPACIEWNTGPVTVRLGADGQVSFNTSAGTTELGFESHTNFGLGLRPVRRLRLDFAPDIDDAADLHAWELAASYEF